MARLWRFNPATSEGKYLVVRRDGTIPTFEHFVLANTDEAAPAGLRGYAEACGRLGYDPEYVADLKTLADIWATAYQMGTVPKGDPDAGRHRVDDPKIIELMRKGGRLLL